MSLGRDRVSRPPRRAHGRVRGWEPGRETGNPDAEDREAEEPLAQRGASDVKERRKAEARWEVQERPRVVEDREAEEAREVDSSNPPKK